MITINTWRDPYDAGFTTTKPKQVSFQPGLTVLVGCNGAGKSTLLMNIKEEVESSQAIIKEKQKLMQALMQAHYDVIAVYQDRLDNILTKFRNIINAALLKGCCCTMTTPGKAIDQANIVQCKPQQYDVAWFVDTGIRMQIKGELPWDDIEATWTWDEVQAVLDKAPKEK